ncbi:barstar family protein [Propioniciclava soli]|uniref:Barstar family protein n=1 Tax=Propioniciclava soli TaxID=2775081 RepID=A0ABZ3C5L8_9ACTN|nr:barstar family protein [Propioniciclava soli]
MNATFAPGMYVTTASAESVAGDWRLAGWTARVVHVDTDEEGKRARRAALVEVGRSLRFGDSFGANLDALEDSLRDLTEPTVLVWARGGAFADAHPAAWETISEVLAARTRRKPGFAFVLADTKSR